MGRIRPALLGRYALPTPSKWSILHQGHVHQEFYSSVSDIPLYTTPSTMAQIMPKALDYRLDARRRGYRVVTLCDAGIDCGGGKAPTSVVRQKEINTYHT